MNDRQQKLSRRKVVAGVGTVGALAAAAAVLPTRQEPTADAAQALPLAEDKGGYRETEHVLHYYRTALV